MSSHAVEEARRARVAARDELRRTRTDQIIDLAEQGVNDSQIARRTGIPRPTVQAIRSRMGVTSMPLVVKTGKVFDLVPHGVEYSLPPEATQTTWREYVPLARQLLLNAPWFAGADYNPVRNVIVLHWITVEERKES